MKKHILLLTVPALLLASCNGGGVNGLVPSGTSITDNTKAEVKAVAEDKKEEVENIVAKGINIDMKIFTDIYAATSSGSEKYVQNMDMKMDIGVQTPSLKMTTTGSQTANVTAQGRSASVSYSVNGISEANKSSGAWRVINDYLDLTSNGNTQRQENVVFAAQTPEAYYTGIIEGLYSWDYEFDAGILNLQNAQVAGNDLFKKLVITGTPNTGTFEVGISAPVDIKIANAGTFNFSKFRVAYKDYLLKETVFRFAMSGSAQGNTSNVTIETSYVVNYNL